MSYHRYNTGVFIKHHVINSCMTYEILKYKFVHNYILSFIIF